MTVNFSLVLVVGSFNAADRVGFEGIRFLG